MSFMEFKPLVSIIIPVYNGSNFMREAIDSAISQTYENIEVIVVNDGSTDNTEEIALSYGEKIRYFKKENGGVSSALNLGIKEMHGKYFSWLSHDDKYAPTKIEKQIEKILKCNDSKTICLCSSQHIDKDSKIIKEKNKDKYDCEKKYSWQEGLLDVLYNGSYNGCSLLIPKIAFKDAGLFNESMRYCQDLFMWINIYLAEYSMIYVNEKLVYGRIHNGQLTQTGRDIFYSDCESMGGVLLPELIKKSSKEYNLIYAFALYNAKYNNKTVVKNCIEKGKEAKLLNPNKMIKIRCMAFYGGIRPFIRKIYYRLFKKIKTT